MVRCRNFQKTLVIEIIPSPSIKDKPIANFHRLFYIRYRPFESNLSATNPNLTNPNLREPESVEDFGEFLWHGVGQETCEFFGCILAVTENPLNGHVDGTLAVHFELKLQVLRHLALGAIFNLVCIECKNQFEIMVAQTVLIVIFKGRFKEQLFFLDIIEFVYKTLVDRLAFSHVFKGFQQNFIEIPVDQIVFILKIPVKSLACDATGFDNLFDGDFLDRCFFHALLHRVCEFVFYIFICFAF